MGDPAQLLAELVSIPSLNPMGQRREGPEFLEAGVTDFLDGFFRELGIPYRRQPVDVGRENVVALFESPGSECTVLLEAHQDTVPADRMTIEPFRPVVNDGRLFGRGACDVKGGLAAMLSAVSRLVRERPDGAASVLMACTVDEEYGATGVRQLVRPWQTARADPGDPFSRLPDMAVVAEPTDLDIVVAHKGAIRWAIQTAGRACHSSRPHEGVNAIYRMARVVTALDEYNRLLPRLVNEHPLCGNATLSVGRIEGGSAPNVVPDECTIVVDRRLVPGEDGPVARQAVEEFLHGRPEIDFPFEMLGPSICTPALNDRENGPLAELFGRAVASVGGKHRTAGVAYGTDAATIAAAGVPAIVFGPGSIRQAHTADEWLALDELHKAAEILYQFLCDAGRRRVDHFG